MPGIWNAWLDWSANIVEIVLARRMKGAQWQKGMSKPTLKSKKEKKIIK